MSSKLDPALTGVRQRDPADPPDEPPPPFPGVSIYRLAGPKGDGRHPYVSEAGAYLGHGTALLDSLKDAAGLMRFKPRSEVELDVILSKAHGRPIDSSRVMGNLRSVANALNNGDVTLASIALAHSRIEPLPDEATAQRLAKADRHLRAFLGKRRHSASLARPARLSAPTTKYSSDQPRVPAGTPGGGRWTSGDSRGVQVASANAGGMDDAGGTPAAHTPPPPPPAGIGVVREYSPEEAANLPPPPSGSKYVTLSDGSVLSDGYLNGGQGGPMLMPKDVLLEDNVRVGHVLAASVEASATVGADMPPREFAMAFLFLPGHGAMDYQSVYGKNGLYNRDYVDFTNYNFGVVAAAAGYSRDEALASAGFVNRTKNWYDQHPNADPPPRKHPAHSEISSGMPT